MNILFLGDVVGKPGREAIKTLVPEIRKKEKLDFVIANGENAAGGSGITPETAEEIFSGGVDVITSGDHIWKKREIYDQLRISARILRPENYPEGAPGKGASVFETASGQKIGVISVVGRVFMDAVDCPFTRTRKKAEELAKSAKVIVVDMHAEATSEKIAMGWYLDGLVSAVVGTHTHVQTSDERILPKGTAYITDLGMTGPHDGVIGRRKEEIIEHFLTLLPTRFEMAEGDVQLHGVIVDVDEKTGKARSIKRIELK